MSRLCPLILGISGCGAPILVEILEEKLGCATVVSIGEAKKHLTGARSGRW